MVKDSVQQENTTILNLYTPKKLSFGIYKDQGSGQSQS